MPVTVTVTDVMPSFLVQSVNGHWPRVPGTMLRMIRIRVILMTRIRVILSARVVTVTTPCLLTDVTASRPGQGAPGGPRRRVPEHLQRADLARAWLCQTRKGLGKDRVAGWDRDKSATRRCGAASVLHVVD